MLIHFKKIFRYIIRRSYFVECSLTLYWLIELASHVEVMCNRSTLDSVKRDKWEGKKFKKLNVKRPNSGQESYLLMQLKWRFFLCCWYCSMYVWHFFCIFYIETALLSSVIDITIKIGGKFWLYVHKNEHIHRTGTNETSTANRMK